MRKIMAVSLMALSLVACSEVPTGNRGLVTRYGEVLSVENEGLVWLNPITTSVNLMDIRQQKWDSETQAYTKDVQQADIKFSLTYRLNPDAVKKVYTTVGTEWASANIPQVVEQSIKDVFGKSEAVKDTINNQTAVQELIIGLLRTRLAARNVIVEGFELRDISFSRNFEAAVEAKQVAVENANAARNRTVEIEENAKQTVIKAKASAEAMRIKSAALAGNPELTAYEAVQRWNGALPQNMYGNAIPFINVK